jgi:hypothetical protein
VPNERIWLICYSSIHTYWCHHAAIATESEIHQRYATHFSTRNDTFARKEP